MVLNALYLMGLNQEQFKDKLNLIYGERVWPNFDVLSAELNIYAEATQRMAQLMKDNNDGKIAAHAVKVNGKPYAKRECWNCGSTQHQKATCDKPAHHCENCGGYGHLEKHCLKKDTSKERTEEAAPAMKKVTGKPKGTASDPKKGMGKFTKSSARTRALKKVFAHLVRMEDEDEDEIVEEDVDMVPDDDYPADTDDVEEDA
jgi:hypothetical protein